MKRSLTVFSGLLIFFTVTAFTTIHQRENTNTDPGIYKLMEVTYLWDLLQKDYQPIRERDDTWLEVGFRSKYAMAKNYASIKMLETAFGCPVFVRGPHQEVMDFNSNTSFGYYNPEFISRLSSSIYSALGNPLFRKAVKRVYQQHLQSMARTYYDAYNYLNRNPDYLRQLQSRYLYLMATPGGIDGGSFQEEFRDYAESLERSQGADVYEAFTAPAFWLRRSIDGTGRPLFELLEMVVTEMDENYKKN